MKRKSCECLCPLMNSDITTIFELSKTYQFLIFLNNLILIDQNTQYG